MGKPRGRKPDPPELRVYKESQRRASGPFAGIRASGDPPKPATIADDPVASAEWDRLVELLADRRILSPADMAALAIYCSTWSTICRNREILRPRWVERLDPETGETIRTLVDPYIVENARTGAMKIHPAAGVLSNAERSLSSFAAELGLSPTARGRVTTIEDVSEHDADDAEFDEFIA